MINFFNWNFAYNINFAERKIEAAMGGGIYFLGWSVAQLWSSVAQYGAA
jgi:hypothetical protein